MWASGDEDEDVSFFFCTEYAHTHKFSWPSVKCDPGEKKKRKRNRERAKSETETETETGQFLTNEDQLVLKIEKS